MHINRKEIDFDQYELMSGKSEYVWDVPDGDMDVRIEIRAASEMSVWFEVRNADGVLEVHPFFSGCCFRETLRIKNLARVFVRTDKKNTLSALVSYRPVHNAENLDYTPALIAAPLNTQLQLSNLVSREIARHMERLGINSNETIEDEDDYEFDDDDDDFEGGYMEQEPSTPPVGSTDDGNGDRGGDRSGALPAGVLGKSGNEAGDQNGPAPAESKPA